MSGKAVTIEERARVAAWILGQVEGKEVSEVDALVQAAIVVLTGEP